MANTATAATSTQLGSAAAPCWKKSVATSAASIGAALSFICNAVAAASDATMIPARLGFATMHANAMATNAFTKTSASLRIPEFSVERKTTKSAAIHAVGARARSRAGVTTNGTASAVAATASAPSTLEESAASRKSTSPAAHRANNPGGLYSHAATYGSVPFSHTCAT